MQIINHIRSLFRRPFRGYIIRYADGPHELCDTYEEARRAVWRRHLYSEVGHPGDLTWGGDHTLCWPDRESARERDPAKAIATIRLV